MVTSNWVGSSSSNLVQIVHSTWNYFQYLKLQIDQNNQELFAEEPNGETLSPKRNVATSHKRFLIRVSQTSRKLET